LFYRSGSAYLNLTSILTASPIPLFSGLLVELESYQAVVSSQYTISLILDYPLSSKGKLILYLPIEVDTNSFTNSSCSAKINMIPMILSQCQLIKSTNNAISFYFNETSTIIQNSNLSLTITGLKNPRLVDTYLNFGV